MLTLLLILPLSPVAGDTAPVVEHINETTPLFQQRGLTTCSEKENEMAAMIVNGIEYRPIPGFSRYYAGDDGSIGTFQMLGNPKRTTDKLRILRQYRCAKKGYLYLTLINDSGQRCSVCAHRIILLAFHGPCPDGMEACHFPDPCRTNNHPNNLRWDTRKGNHADKIYQGTYQIGEKNPAAKLTAEQVETIKERLLVTINSRIRRGVS